MDSHAERKLGLNLPEPSAERSTTGHALAEEGLHEVAKPKFDNLPPDTFVQTPGGVSAQDDALLGVPASPHGSGGLNTFPSSISTDDASDALDEEWVKKAKAVVERTKHDPYLESHELSKVKADYLRIRYSKHIKVAEERPQ